MGKKFASVVMFDVAASTALALWVVFGNTAAESVFKAYFWIVTPLSILAYFLSPKSLMDLARSPWWFLGYARGVRIVTLVLLAMARETVMLGALILAWLAFESAMRWCIDQENADETQA